MSKANALEKLLDGAEVQWKPLGELCKIETGRLNANAAVENGKYMFFTTAKETSRIDNYRWDTEALLIAGNANVGEVKHYIGKFDAYQRTYVLTNFNQYLNVRFLFFVINNNLKKYLEEKTNSAAMTYIVLSTLENFQVPIPCPDDPKKSLAIQAEIVRILDAFTALTAELTAELTARKKQYNHYRDQLLTFSDGNVEWKPLSALANFSQGIQVDVSDQLPEKLENYVRFLRIVDFVKDDEVPRYIKNPGQRYLKEDGDLVMIRYGASAAGKVFLNHCGAIANNMFKINLTTKELTNKFLHAYLSLPRIYNYLNSNGGTSTMPAITFGQIGAVNIPVPSLNEQARIVAILDKFDALTNSLQEGLPREIGLRQKQYEYYRDMLLNFPKPDKKAA